MKSIATPILLLSALSACGSAPPASSAAPAKQTIRQVSLDEVGLDAAAMDRSIDPCDDFYQFACGGWEKATTIPADKPRWGRSFSEIHKRNELELKRILEEAASGKSADSATKRIGDFYAGCMDEEGVDRAGTGAIKELLELAANVQGKLPIARGKSPTAASLEKVLSQLHQHRIYAFFDIGSAQDFKDATKMIAHIDQNGLGLPDRDDYLKDGKREKELRAFYVLHVARMLEMIGLSPRAAKAAAGDVMHIETALAKISKSRVERRDPKGMYNKIDQEGLRKRTSGFSWQGYLKARKLDQVTDISVTSVPFVEGMGTLISGLSQRQLASYLRWQILHQTAAALPSKFVDEDFLLTAQITGQKEQQARWKRCIAATDGALGELLAQPYVAKNFSPESKKAVTTMVGEIRGAFGKELTNLAWMDEATRSKAHGKLHKMAFLIGYPDQWKKYDFPIDRSKHGDNELHAASHEVTRQLAKIGKPVDRGEWYMTPPTVNAYYSPLKNQMVFPAGILQPPFFNADSSVAVNMGGMGMVVGHELTHGFDDQGSQFDADGNLKSWWAPKVRTSFEERTKCVDEQYSQYEVLPGVKLNGKLTLGENIADAGGVKLAFRAYRAMRESAPEALVAEGFNEDQQFFLSVGQIWCTKYREAFARLRATTDPHSQPNFRVNGALINSPEFAEAFSCAPQTPMHPATTCSVW